MIKRQKTSKTFINKDDILTKQEFNNKITFLGIKIFEDIINTEQDVEEQDSKNKNVGFGKK